MSHSCMYCTVLAVGHIDQVQSNQCTELFSGCENNLRTIFTLILMNTNMNMFNSKLWLHDSSRFVLSFLIYLSILENTSKLHIFKTLQHVWHHQQNLPGVWKLRRRSSTGSVGWWSGISLLLGRLPFLASVSALFLWNKKQFEMISDLKNKLIVVSWIKKRQICN